MIRPLDNERCNRGISFKRNKIMKKQKSMREELLL